MVLSFEKWHACAHVIQRKMTCFCDSQEQPSLGRISLESKTTASHHQRPKERTSSHQDCCLDLIEAIPSIECACLIDGYHGKLSTNVCGCGGTRPAAQTSRHRENVAVTAAVVNLSLYQKHVCLGILGSPSFIGRRFHFDHSLGTTTTRTCRHSLQGTGGYHDPGQSGGRHDYQGG